MIFNPIAIQQTLLVQLLCAQTWITENICLLQFHFYANALNKQSLIPPIKQRPTFCGGIAWGHFNVPGKHFNVPGKHFNVPGKHFNVPGTHFNVTGKHLMYQENILMYQETFQYTRKTF